MGGEEFLARGAGVACARGDGGCRGAAGGRVRDQRFRRFEEVEEFAERAPEHSREVEVHVFGHVARRARFPVLQHGVGSWVDFFDVMVHVFDEEDVVVEGFFVLGIAGARQGRNAGGAGEGGLFGDEF